MNIHKNAAMTPKGRAHLVREIERIGLKPAAAAAGLSERTARKWQRRHAAEGAAGLLDRSSRPGHSPRRSPASKLERAVALRRTQRLTYERIAERLGLSRSTVARACKAAGVARLPALQEAVPVRRYERAAPGELLHLDTKKLARFARPGHRATGDRTQNTRGAGWQALHVAIDDHSRVGFSLLLADETARSACAFVLAALRYYKSLGVRVEQVMTDNGSAYNSRRFAPGREGRAGDDRQRFGLQLAPICQVAAPPGHPPHPHAPVHATHQRQGRALHPDFAARVGLRVHLPQLRASCPRVGPLDVPLQLPSAALGYLRQAAHHSPRLRGEQRGEKLQLDLLPCSGRFIWPVNRRSAPVS